MAPKYCSMKLGTNGAEFTRTTDAVALFQKEMRSKAFQSLTLDAQTEKRRELSASRFFASRDESGTMKDIAEDPDVARRLRKFSITRDAMTGPMLADKFINVGSASGLGSNFTTSNVDRERFMREADRLRMNRIVDEADLPDWYSDDSIYEFFAKVYDKAMEEAKNPARMAGFNKVVDAAPGIYLFTELLKRTEKLIEEDFTEMWARRIFPILQLNTWLPQWSFERIDDRGVLPQPVDVEYLPSNAPRGGENRVPQLCQLVFFAHAASWSNLELMRYAEGVANGAPNIKLDQRRINTAIRMMNMREDLYAFFGDKDVNQRGLFSPTAETGIERITGGPQFGATNAEADRQILTGTVKTILSNTEQILSPNTIMLGTDSWLYVNDKRYGDLSADSNQTVLTAAMETLDKFGIEEVIWVPECGNSAAQVARLKDHGVPDPEATRLGGGVGVAGQEEMVVMRRDPEVAELVVAKDRIMYPAREERNDRVEVRMLQGTGAMAFYKPAAIKIVTHVTPTTPAP